MFEKLKCIFIDIIYGNDVIFFGEEIDYGRCCGYFGCKCEFMMFVFKIGNIFFVGKVCWVLRLCIFIVSMFIWCRLVIC